MAKTLSTKNVKDWKTTVLGILGGLVMLAGILMPDKIDPETQQSLNTAFSQIVMGVGGAVGIIVSIFGKD